VGAAELVGQERQRGQAFRGNLAQVLGYVEDLDQAGVATADHRDIRAVRRGPAKGLLENVTRHAKRELHLHPDHVGEKRNKLLG